MPDHVAIIIQQPECAAYACRDPDAGTLGYDRCYNHQINIRLMNRFSKNRKLSRNLLPFYLYYDIYIFAYKLVAAYAKKNMYNPGMNRLKMCNIIYTHSTIMEYAWCNEFLKR